MTRNRILLVLALVIGHWSLVIPTFAEPLRWKLKSGDEFLAKLEQHPEIGSSLGGGAPAVMTLDTGMELGWQVTAVDEHGAADISQRFQRLRMKLEMPKSGAISYDSASETKPTGDAKTIAAAVQPLLDAEIKLTLSPRGEITRVELDEAAQKAVAGLEASNPLKNLLSKEGVANVLRQSVVILPAGDVQPGDQWLQTTTLSTALGKFKQTTTFKLLEPESKSPDVARIESVSNLEREEAPAAKSRPVTLKQQHQTGLALFDTSAGRLTSASVEQELVTASMLKDTPIQVKLVSTLKMTLEPK
jgi:hypothetical protein